jgi:hypothetical protein
MAQDEIVIRLAQMSLKTALSFLQVPGFLKARDCLFV